MNYKGIPEGSTIHKMTLKAIERYFIHKGLLEGIFFLDGLLKGLSSLGSF